MYEALNTYLKQNQSAATSRIYLFEIRHYLNHMGLEKAQKATYQDIMDYLLFLRKRYDNPSTITRIIYAIKQYYYWLVHTGQRSDHPCRYLKLKDRKSHSIQVQDLLTPSELQLLLQRKERYTLLENRNQVILTLLVYQALLPLEMANLDVADVDLRKASIYIKSTYRTNSRTLKLQADQIMIFHRYLHEVRPQLEKTVIPALLLTSRGTPEKGEGIHYLIETFRPHFPKKRLTPMTIRQSVIARQLKAGIGLRQVQVFAGHKRISATEQYRQTNLEVLQEQIRKYHPLTK